MMELDPLGVRGGLGAQGLGEVGGRDLYKRAQESSTTCCRSAEREAAIFFLFFYLSSSSCFLSEP
jgi:hypothetical protein